MGYLVGIMKDSRTSGRRFFPHTLLLYGFFACTGIIASETVDPCQPSIASLPVTDVKLDNGNTARGIKFQVGTPPQTLATRPATWGDGGNKNKMYLEASKPDGESIKSCLELFFNGTDTPAHNQGCTTLIGGTLIGTKQSDKVILGENATFPDFAFRYEYSVERWTSFGVADDSVLMKAVKTKSWGYDQGLTGGYPYGASSPLYGRRDGLMTVGGFDAARLFGEAVPHVLNPSNFNDECSIEVEVDSITYRDTSGRNIALQLGDNRVACIDPSDPILGLPSVTFNQITGIYGSKYNDGRIKTSMYYGWGTKYTAPFFSRNLTITLKGGFTTTIPNSELSVPHVGILESGQVGITDVDLHVLLFGPRGSEKVHLGQPFLSAVYMYVNWENPRSLYLSRPARLGTSSEKHFEIVAEKPSQLEPILPPGCKQSTGPADKSAPTGDSNSGKSASLSKGVIAGIVVAIPFGLSSSGLAAWFYRRSRRISSHAEPSQSNILNQELEDTFKRPESQAFHELPHLEFGGGSRHSPSELDADGRHELPAGYVGNELRGDSDAR